MSGPDGGAHLDAASRHWWAAVADRVLLVQRCAACRRLQHPPGPRCRQCHAPAPGWCEHDGSGTVVGCSQIHTTTYPERRDSTPYWVASVALGSEHDDAYLVTNLVDLGDRVPAVGDAVRVAWTELGDRVLPGFTLCAETGR